LAESKELVVDLGLKKVERENLKIRVDLKKGHQKFWQRKWNFCSGKVGFLRGKVGFFLKL